MRRGLFSNTKQFEELQRFGARHVVPLLRGYSPLPLGVVFVLTMRCNMRCEMCVQSEQRREYVHQRDQELSLAELQGVLEDLRASFPLRPMIHVSGGEPFLHRDLFPFLREIKSRGFRCSLTTNGYLLEGKAQELVEVGVDRMNVSLDGPAAIHDRVRNTAGAFDRAVAGIQAVAQHKRQSGAHSPRVTINSVMTCENQPYMAEMVEVAQRAGAQGLSFQHLKFDDEGSDDAGDRVLHRLDVERLIDEMPPLAKQAAAAGLALTFFPRLSARQIRNYYQRQATELGGYCLMPWFVMRIRLGGEISPCSGYVVDNVRSKRGTLRQVWNSSRYRAFRRNLAERGVLATCGRCCHRRYP